MVSHSRRALVDELAAFDRLLEVGVGNRPGVARALADRGCDVVAIDIDALDDGAIVASEPDGAESTGAGPTAGDASGNDDPRRGSVGTRQGDVVALADADDPIAALWAPSEEDGFDAAFGRLDGFDAVYGLNLPAELQRPTVRLAARLHAACLFTTLGFEEPVVPVRRRSLPGATLFVADRGSDAAGRSR